MQQPTKPDYKEVPLVETPTVAHDWPGHLDGVEEPTGIADESAFGGIRESESAIGIANGGVEAIGIANESYSATGQSESTTNAE